MNIQHLRQDYKSTPLTINSMAKDPLDEFNKWFESIKDSSIEPNAMSLATVSTDNIPAVRTVLLKEVTKTGFIFYTNYNSNKAKDIASNPNVGLAFNWLNATKQICIQGKAVKIPSKASDEYFKSRPRSSQIGAWASNQSSIITDRKFLEDKFNYFEGKFQGKKIPRPDFWGGYCVTPIRIEFWQGCSSRLHDRFLYLFENNNWNISRLSP
jgi:pyridoxamine 5'-phosphate oxidase